MISLYTCMGLLVVVYCLMCCFRHLLLVWIVLWTALISFAYANCHEALAHTFSVSMIASQLAMLGFFAILPSQKPWSDAGICSGYCHGFFTFKEIAENFEESFCGLDSKFHYLVFLLCGSKTRNTL